MAQQYGPKIITDGLVLSLDAADKNSYPGSGTTWSDLSGNGINGTLTAASIGTDVPGSMDFNGSSEYVNLNEAGTPGASNGSVCAWIKLSGEANNHASIFCNQTGPAWVNMRLDLNIKTPNQPYFHLADGVSHTGYGIIASALNYSQWYYVVGTYDGTYGKIYVDGVQNGSYSTSITPGTYTTSFCAIGYMNYSDRYFPGNIDIVQWYDKTLSTKEISQNFNAQRSRFGV